ncbi:MAG: hypothetical protein H0X50_05400 [Nitrosopumilus sp.]|nr:hypothetical protein [Nitrosopumilus sp.]
MQKEQKAVEHQSKYPWLCLYVGSTIGGQWRRPEMLTGFLYAGKKAIIS